MATGSLQLGGNMSLAVGPMGRSAEASGALNSSGKVAAMFSYSKSQGLFGGVSLEGSALVDRSDANSKAYHRSVTAKQILSGDVDPPNFAVGLIGTIERLTLSNSSGRSPNEDYQERDSWSIDGGDNFSNDAAGRAGHNENGLENYFSQAELNSRQRKFERAQHSTTSSRMSPSASRSTGRSADKESNPFAASDDEDAAAYSLDRDNATRNHGAYSFSSQGGGSATNSPSSSTRGTDYGRQRSSSKSSKQPGGYFDNLDGNGGTNDGKSSPSNGKRPILGHRKASSSFSIPKFGKKAQTPPPFGSNGSYRKTPPPDSLLSNNNVTFDQEFRNSMSSSEDEGNHAYTSKPTSKLGPAFGTGDGFSSSSSPSRDPYANGGLKKTSPADAIRAAASGLSSPGGSALSQARQKASDAFGDLWSGAKANSTLYPRENGSLDSFDAELQNDRVGGKPSKPPANRSSSYGSSRFSGGIPGFSSSSASTSPTSSRPGSGAQVDRPKFGRSPSAILSKTFRTGSGGRMRSNSYNKSLALGSASEDDDADWRTAKDDYRNSSNAAIGDYPSRSGGATTPRARGMSGTATTPRALNTSTSSSANRSIFDDEFSTPQTEATNHIDSSSIASLPSQGSVIASFDFAGQEADDLSFFKGDVIVILQRTASTNDWWVGKTKDGRVGSFPANFTEEL